jgi:hypothetical protein
MIPIGTCKTIEYYTTATGVMPLLYSIRDCIPIAFPAILFAIFFVLFGGSMFVIKNRTGREKVFTSLLASSFVCVILGMFLLLGMLINYKVELFWGFICIVFFILLTISDKY